MYAFAWPENGVWKVSVEDGRTASFPAFGVKNPEGTTFLEVLDWCREYGVTEVELQAHGSPRIYYLEEEAENG